MVDWKVTLKTVVVLFPGLVSLILITIGISSHGWIRVTTSEFTPFDDLSSRGTLYRVPVYTRGWRIEYETTPHPIKHWNRAWWWKPMVLVLEVGLYDYRYDMCNSEQCVSAESYLESSGMYLKFPIDELFSMRLLLPGRFLGPTGLFGVILGLIMNIVFIRKRFKRPTTLCLPIATWLITALVLTLLFSLHISQNLPIYQALFRYRLYFADYLQIKTMTPWSIYVIGVAMGLCYVNPIIIAIVFCIKPMTDDEVALDPLIERREREIESVDRITESTEQANIHAGLTIDIDKADCIIHFSN